MSAFISLGVEADAPPHVTYFPDLRGEQIVSVRIGHSSIHLDPDTARQLAADILAALPEVTR